jgi:molybdate transport system substrate-binding protein
MRVLVLLAAAALCVRAAAPAETTLTVLAAASLKTPLERAAIAFEKEHPGVRVVVSAAATGVLSRQLEAGAPGDIIVGAAAGPMETLQQKGLVGPSIVVARNALVLAVPKGSTLVPASLGELRGPAFKRIAIGRPGVVPAGQYAQEVLGKSGLLEVLSDRLVFGESVTQVLTYVRQGDVEAGFIYASDAKSAASEVRVALVIDPKLHAPIVYPAASVSRSAHPELAGAFVAFLAAPAGQRLLRDAGLEAP